MQISNEACSQINKQCYVVLHSLDIYQIVLATDRGKIYDRITVINFYAISGILPTFQNLINNTQESYYPT